MRIPDPHIYKKWIRYIMYFCLGMLLGTVLQLIFIGKELDKLHLLVDSLENENTALNSDVRQYKTEREKAQQSREPIVEDVQIHILEPKPDAFTESELIRLIAQDTQYLEGKSLDAVNELHLSVRQQFKDRIYRVKNEQVQTELKTMLIYTTIHLYIYAKPLPPSL